METQRKEKSTEIPAVPSLSHVPRTHSQRQGAGNVTSADVPFGLSWNTPPALTGSTLGEGGEDSQQGHLLVGPGLPSPKAVRVLDC